MHPESVKVTLPEFDSTQLLEELANARSPIPVVKPLLARIQDESYAFFRQTLDAVTLVKHRSKLLDQVLSCLWQHSGLPQTNITLIAVGGYGRGELHPHSDIDLLLLCADEESLTAHSEELQSFITLLWDLKLNVGHSVRTLEECGTAAQDDLTIITNLMESRVITGDALQHDALLANISPEVMWPANEFFNAKWEELRNRHRKHNDSEYNLEPNVKNSPGALRDIQTVCWATMRHFGQGTLKSLEEKGFLTSSEYERLQRSLYFLWQVRYALHMLADREEDRLLFQLQREVASLLDFKDDGHQLGVEQFMKQFYRNQLATMELCDLLLLHFNEDFMKRDHKPEIEELNEHFRLNNGYLQVNNPKLFVEQPQWLLEVFLLMARTLQAKGIHSKTIRALRDHRHLINDDYRKNPKHNAIFIELLHNGTRVVREFRRMMRYGILGSYIPEFGHIIGMMEHDLFHIHTVDEHSFRMMHFLRRLRFGEARERFPLAAELALKHLDRKEILYLSALLHDTGKHLEGNHTSNSGVIAEAFCKQHNLPSEYTHLVSWLCANHLYMSQASQRLELNSPEDVHSFAVEVKDQLHLDLLYLISVGDIVSTNPKHWTSWRAEQINTLYKNASIALERGLDQQICTSEKVAEIQKLAKAELIAEGMSAERIDEIWGEPGDEYFIREGVNNIVWHTQVIDAHGPSEKPLVVIRPTSNRQFEGATQIFIYMKDQINLFAATTATLDQLNLNIQDARIMTSENEKNVVDTYIVLDELNQPIEDEERLEKIRLTLIEALSDPESYSTIIQRRTPRALKQFKVETKVNISNDPLVQHTIIEVIAADRPGLLARMGAIFAELNLQLLSAKILTEGEQVLDIFHILNQHGQPLADENLCRELEQAVIEGLTEQVKAQSAV